MEFYGLNNSDTCAAEAHGGSHSRGRCNCYSELLILKRKIRDDETKHSRAGGHANRLLNELQMVLVSFTQN